MLIISIPRSASTSLLNGLSKIMNLPSEPIYKKSGKSPRRKVKGYDLLPHSGCRQYSPEELTKSVCSKTHIYRDHVLPIQEHRNILMQIPMHLRRVVVLKRPAEECYASVLAREGTVPTPIPTNIQQPVMDQYSRFAANLESMFPESDGFLHVNYHDLIDNHDWWIKRILDYWGFRYPLKDKYMLDLFHISDRYLETENYKKTYTGTLYEKIKEIKLPGMEDFYIGTQPGPGWKKM